MATLSNPYDDILVDDLLKRVKGELMLATNKFAPFNSTHEGYAVILEEMHELWAEVRYNNLHPATEEALQVAAMGVRFVYDLSILKAAQ